MNGLSKLLIIISIFLSHLPQLKIPFLTTTTRPVFQIFFVPILIRNFNKIKMDKLLKIKWLIFSFIFFYYLIIGLILYQDIYTFLKYLIGFIFFLLFYIFSYSRGFLKEKIFYKINLFSFLFISLIGFLQIAGAFNILLIDIANFIRKNLLSVVLDKERLSLLFSEPSFLASYFIYLFLIIDRLIKIDDVHKKYYFTIKIILFVFIIFSKSLYTYLAVLVLLFGQFIFSSTKFKNKLILIIILSLFLIVIIKLSFNRIQNVILFQDLSFLSRFIYIEALISMLISSKFFGFGIGGFGDYFQYYLNNKYNFPIFPFELIKYLDGNIHANPFSLFFQFLGETGVLGIIAFFVLIFHGFLKSNYKPYYIAIFITTLSALPWGLPYFWLTIGLLHSLNNKYKRI